MSYKALYRKYRPSTFNEIVGQEHITTTLENIVISGKINHAYLFVGPHGTGKTSTAIVFAKTINCVDRHAEDKWAICKSMDWNTASLDIMEIDAASNNGVAEIRNIIENSRYAPTKLKYKVYIIDEVHMLSKGAFNALLKILEDPPKSVIFILATTEPEKIPATVLSRIQRYNFSRIEDKVISNQLKEILDKENIQYEEEAINEITSIAHGSLRDAISIADQTSAYGDSVISAKYVSIVFGLLSKANKIKLLNMLMHGKVQETLTSLRVLYSRGINIYRLVTSLIEILKEWIIYDKTKNLANLTILNEEALVNLKINKLFAYRTIEELYELSKRLKYSGDPKSMFEFSVLKILDFSRLKDKTETLNSSTNDFSLVSPEEATISISADRPLPKQEFTNESVSLAEKVEVEEVFSLEPEPTPPPEDAHEKTSTFETDPVFTEKEPIELSQDIKPEVSESTPSNDLINLDFSSDFEKLKEETKPMSVDESVKNSPKTDPINITQELTASIELEEKEEVEENSKEIDTSEIDISQLFSLNEPVTEVKEVKTQIHDLEFLLSVLKQSNKDSIPNIRQKFNMISSFVKTTEEQSYVTYLTQLKIIATGDNFILASSDSNTIIDTLNELNSEESFVRFIDRVVGKLTNLYLVTKSQFDELKDEWSKRKENGSQIQDIIIKVNREELPQEETAASQFMNDIFGS